MEQEEFYFGRRMEPFDYKASLAQTLERDECISVPAYEKKEPKKAKEAKEEGFSK